MELTEEQIKSLKKLREPFPENQIGKLAKGSKAQTQCQPNQKKKCNICGGWHHPDMIHLDYVGHAALTDRLLDVDPCWFWEPMGHGADGLPVLDNDGGLWIKLTICGMTRIGYGNAEKSQYKEIGAREKEVIGDALRNAAMRFGAALDLWHKGDLHKIDNQGDTEEKPQVFYEEYENGLEAAFKEGGLKAGQEYYKRKISLIEEQFPEKRDDFISLGKVLALKHK